MNVYIWKYLDGVSPSYHSGGGLMVVAESLKQAIDLAESHKEPGETSCYIHIEGTEPNFIYPTAPETPCTVLTFPDAGCC